MNEAQVFDSLEDEILGLTSLDPLYTAQGLALDWGGDVDKGEC